MILRSKVGNYVMPIKMGRSRTVPGITLVSYMPGNSKIEFEIHTRTLGTVTFSSNQVTR